MVSVRGRLCWSESDIAFRWVHGEYNLMLTLSSDKDRRKNSALAFVFVQCTLSLAYNEFRLQRAPNYNEQFLLHLFIRFKRNPVHMNHKRGLMSFKSHLLRMVTNEARPVFLRHVQLEHIEEANTVQLLQQHVLILSKTFKEISRSEESLRWLVISPHVG